MEILIKVLQVILSLSILVVFHEGGHFFPAKWFKTRVEKFYLFFDPYFALFKKKIGDTEYGIGWLPFGGYVKISGMIDESFDKDQMIGEPQPWEFRSKPAWQRFIIMVGGVTVNFILGILIFIMIFFKYGTDYVPTSAVKDGIYVDTIGYSMGLRTGDHIKKIGNRSFDRFEQGVAITEIAINDAKTIDVIRNGTPLTIEIDEKIVPSLTKQGGTFLFDGRVPFDIADVVKGKKGLFKSTEDGPAAKAGIQANDRIIAINETPIQFFDEAIPFLRANKNKPLRVKVLREGAEVPINLTPNNDGKIGVFHKSIRHYVTPVHEDYTFSESVSKGWNRAWSFLGSQIIAFKKMFTGQISAKDNLGSVISIGNLFPGTWDWRSFWNITAVLSMILGFMNLLPIPALDGGYIMFLFWEMITGKKVSDKTMEVANTIGFILLIGLMIFALGLDFSRLF